MYFKSQTSNQFLFEWFHGDKKMDRRDRNDKKRERRERAISKTLTRNIKNIFENSENRLCCFKYFS